MKNLKTKVFLLFLLVFGLAEITKAAHLLGGQFEYFCVAKGIYKVRIKAYRDGNAQAQFDAQIEVGIYAEDPANPNAPKVRLDIQDFDLVDTSLVVRTVPAGCPPPQPDPNFKVQEGIYEKTIFLPDNPAGGGYYLTYARCCRTQNLVNYISTQQVQAGTTFFCYIPKIDIIDKSSPYFIEKPIPKACRGNLFILPNTAMDDDGDSIVYSFVQAYDMAYEDVSATSPTPSDPLVWPIKNVGFQPGCTINNPFNGGSATIDAATGVTQMVIPQTGNYVLAIDIKEYRNGQLIGIIRRDLQIASKSCPAEGPPPTFKIDGGTNLVYRIEEGDNISFTAEISAPKANMPVIFTATSELLDPNKFNPPATFPKGGNGIGQLQGTFSWQTKCGQGRTAPYNVVVAVVAGCDTTVAKTYTVQIYVDKPSPSITGSVALCRKQKGTAYLVNAPKPSSQYLWAVKYGVPVSGAGNSFITDWNIPVSVTNVDVSVTETNSFNCKGTKVTNLPINNILSENVTLPADYPNVCPDEEIQFGLSSGKATLSYTWTPPTGLDNPNIFNPKLTISNFSNSVNYNQTYTVMVSDANGCFLTRSTDVEVLPRIDAEPVQSFVRVCSNTSFVNGPVNMPGLTYLWSTALPSDLSYLSSITAAQPTFAFSNFFTAKTVSFTVKVTRGSCAPKYGSFLLKLSPLPDVKIDYDASKLKCPFDSINLQASGASFFEWRKNNPNSSILLQAKNANGSIINVAPTSAQTTYYCRGYNVDSCYTEAFVVVNTKAAVNVSIIPSNPMFNVCDGNPVSVSATYSNNYQWYDLADPNVILSTSDNFSTVVKANSTYLVKGTDAQGCHTYDTLRVVKLPLPVFSVSRSKDTVCSLTPLNLLMTPAASYNYDIYDQIFPNSYIASGATASVAPVFDNIYKVVATNGTTGCKAEKTINTPTWPLPQVNTALLNDTLCKGSKLKIAVGGSALAYTWYKNGSQIGVPNQFSFEEILVNTGTYEVEGVDFRGCKRKNQNIITAVNPPVLSVTPATPQLLCSKDTLIITAKPSDGYKGIYTWTENSNTYESNGEIVFKALTPGVRTSVVSFTNEYGCEAQKSVTITTAPLPSLSQISGPQTICPGVAGITYKANGAATSTYYWFTQDGTLIGATNSANQQVDWNLNQVNGKISVVEQTSNNCISDTVSLNVEIGTNAKAPELIGKGILCGQGGTESYFAPNIPPGASLRWFIQNGQILGTSTSPTITVLWPNIDNNIGRLFYVIDQNTNLSFCNFTSPSKVIKVSPKPTASVIDGPTIICSESGVSNFGVDGLSESKFTWVINPTTLVSYAPPYYNESTGSLTLVDSKVGLRFGQLLDSFGKPINYTVNIAAYETSVDGCVGDLIFKTVNIVTKPIINGVVGPDTICASIINTTSYTVTDGLLGVGFDYIWSINGGEVLSYSADNQTVEVMWPNDFKSGTVTLIKKYQFSGLPEEQIGGCASDPFVIKVVKPDLEVKMSKASVEEYNDKKINVEWEIPNLAQAAIYRVYRRPVTSPTSVWKLIGIVVGKPSITDTLVNADEGSFEYKFSSPDFCGFYTESTPHRTMHLSPLFKVTDAGINLQLAWNHYKFFNKGLDHYEVYRQLDEKGPFELLSVLKRDSVFQMLWDNKAIKQRFKIKAFEQNSSNVTFSNDTLMELDSELDIPNTFTPNGDGKNDQWNIKSLSSYPKSKIEIYNRWGKLVYEKLNYSGAWDGRSSEGVDLNSGTYFYILTLNAQERNTTFTGAVTIIK